MDTITHEMRMANWKPIIEQCHARPEGQTARQWLAERGISEKQFYYWQRRIREDAYNQLAGVEPSRLRFMEIPSSGFSISAGQSHFQPDVIIRSAKVTIELSNSVSDQLLTRLLGGLANAK